MKKISNKGFTLVEVLAAVAILGILSSIAVISVIKTIDKSHMEYDQKQAKLFTTAAQSYFTDNRSELPEKLLTEKEVTLKTLIEKNYIDEIVDYKKNAYNSYKSKAYAKKTGAGKYIYYSVLVGSDNRKIDDNTLKNKVSGNISVSIKSYDSTLADRTNTINNVYYINKKLLVNIKGRSTGEGISSYQYRIDKLSTITSSNGKKYKTSGEIVIDDKVFSDSITIDAKDFANGIYKLYVYAYDYDGATSKVAESKIIVIDKTKPKCSIKLEGTKGNKEIIEDVEKQWYKKGEEEQGYTNVVDKVTLTMAIEDKNKYKNRLEKEEYTSGQLTSNINEVNKVIKYQTDSTTTDGQNWYGVVEDKAGNLGYCNTTVYFDKVLPKCKVTKTIDNIEIGDVWTNQNYTATKSCEDDNSLCKDGATSTKYVSVGNGAWTNNNIFESGNVEDRAGNKGECPVFTEKLDRQCPKCKVTSDHNGWTKDAVTVRAECDDYGASGCENSLSHTYDIEGGSILKIESRAGAQGESNGGQLIDRAGNITYCPADQTVLIDKKAPKADIEGASTQWTTESRTITIRCNDEGGSGCNSNSENVDRKFDISTRIWSKHINFTDNVGNSLGRSTAINVYVDNTPPVLSCSPGAGWSNAMGTCTITANDETSGMARIRHKQQDYETADGKLTFVAKENSYSNGGSLTVSYPQYKLTVRAIDVAGNDFVEKKHCVTNYDSAKPNTPTLTKVEGKESDNVKKVSSSCDKIGTPCQITATRKNKKEWAKITWSAQAADKAPTTANGSSGVAYYINAYNCSNGASCQTTTNDGSDGNCCPKDNAKNVVVTAVDNAGNVSDPLTITFTWN